MPMYIDNRRVFEWRDGKLLKALKEKTWILLDEINLLPAQVLESLVPLLNGSAEAEGFAVPGKLDQERLRVQGARIFATMNPSVEGGGRTRLSRSIKNAFVTVQMDSYRDDDLYEILKKQFQELIEQDLIEEDHLQNVFDVYKRVERLVETGQIQGMSRKQTFNLRDLAAVRDIVAKTIKTQMSHHRLITCDESQDSAPVFDSKAVTLSVIRKALQLVFKHRFHDRAAQDEVQHVIDETVRSSQTELSHGSASTIDVSVSELIRIGSVYMEKDESQSSRGSLVPTVDTVCQLELLATACQSQRAVLLEGPTCSKKTSLVKELAALTGTPLFILSLHRDFEASDLIGQWLPVLARDVEIDLLECVRRLRNDVASLGLKGIERTPHDKRVLVYKTLKKLYTKSSSTVTLEEAKHTIESIKIAIEALKGCRSTSTGWNALTKMASDLEDRVFACADASASTVFKFVESNLVKALKAGSFVLFDNINAASPDVIDRLLSLFEEVPFLNLHEHSDGERLTVGSGIHPTTRIFATADRKKMNTFGLSSPLLNRMIKIWLPQIDAEVCDLELDELERHEIVDIVSNKFETYAGHRAAALLVSSFHGRVTRLAKTSEISITKDAKISFRMLEQASSVIRSWLSKNESLFSAVAWGLWRTYASVLENERDLKLLQTTMWQLCDQITDLPLDRFYTVNGRSDMLTSFQQESSDIQSVFAHFVQACMKRILRRILDIEGHPSFLKAITLFLRKLFLKLHPQEISNANDILKNARTASEFAHLCAQRGSSVARYLEETSETESRGFQYFSQDPERLTRMAKRFVRNSTFVDWRQRKAFVQDVGLVLKNLHSVLDDDAMDDVEELVNDKRLVKTLSSVRRVIQYFHPLERESFVKHAEHLSALQQQCSDKALRFNIRKMLGCTLVEADTKLLLSIRSLATEADVSTTDINKTAISFSFAALDFKASLLLDDRLLLFHQESIAAEEVIEIQRMFSRLKVMAEVHPLMDRALRAGEPRQNTEGVITSCSDLAPSFSQSVEQNFYLGNPDGAGPSTSSGHRPDEDIDANASVQGIIQQFDCLMGSTDCVLATQHELDSAVDLHSSILAYLQEEARADHCVLDKIDVTIRRRLQRRLEEFNESSCTSDFHMVWAVLFNPTVKTCIPYRMMRCCEEHLYTDLSGDAPIAATILVGQLGSCTPLSDLISLVVIEQQQMLPDTKDSKKSIKLQHYVWSQEGLSTRKWLRQWMKAHENQYIVTLEECQLTREGCFDDQQSRLSCTLLTCLYTLTRLPEHEIDIDPSDDRRARLFISELESQMKTFKGFVDAHFDEKDNCLSRHLLYVDATLRRAEFQGVLDMATKKQMIEAVAPFESTELEVVKNSINAKLKEIEEKLTSSECESASYAFSLKLLLEKLKDCPVQELTVCLKSLLQKTEHRFGDFFAALDFISPVLKLKDFLIGYLTEAVNVKSWKTCQMTRLFISDVVASFVALLVIDDDGVRLDTTHPLKDFDDWQERFDRLTAKLSVPPSLLTENDLHDVFRNLKRRFEDLKSKGIAKDSACAVDSHIDEGGASKEQNGYATTQECMAMRRLYDLKRDFQELWKKAKSHELPLTSVMFEAMKSVQALDCLTQADVNEISLARYQVKLDNLKTKMAEPHLQESSHTEDVLSEALQDLLTTRAGCVAAADFSFTAYEADLASSADVQRVVQSMQQLYSIVYEPHDTKDVMDYLIGITRSCQRQSVWEMAIEAARRCKAERKLKERWSILQEMSNMHIFSDDLSIKMAFQEDGATNSALLEAAVDELIRGRGSSLMEDYLDILSGWTTGEVQKAVDAVLDLCCEEKLSVIRSFSLLEELRGRRRQLQEYLNAHASTSDKELSFACPKLHHCDVAVVFSFDAGRLHSLLLNAPTLRTGAESLHRDPHSHHAHQHGGLLSLCHYRQENASPLGVFQKCAHQINALIAAFNQFKLERELKRKVQEDVDRRCAILEEVYSAMQFVMIPWMLSIQDYSFLWSMVQLSSTDASQKRVETLDQNIKNDEKYLADLQRQLEDRRALIDLEKLTQSALQQEKDLKSRISAEKERIEFRRRDLEEANVQMVARRVEICDELANSLKQLLEEGALCFGKTIDSTGFEAFLPSRRWEDKGELFSLSQLVFSEAGNVLNSKKGVSAEAQHALDKWLESNKQFCDEDLTRLAENDPFRQALQIICKAARLGNLKAAQLLSTVSDAKSSEKKELEEISNTAMTMSIQLKEICADSYCDQSEIQRMAKDLLCLEERCRNLQGENSSHTQKSSLAYIKNLILQSVHVCCAYAHAMHPMPWYRDDLHQLLTASGMDMPLETASEDRMLEDMRILPCVWRTCRFSILSGASEHCLVNPFQLSWIMDRFIHRHAPLYKPVSYAGRLFGQELMYTFDVTFKREDSEGRQHVLFDLELQPLYSLSTQLLDLNETSLLLWTVEQIHHCFSSLSAALDQLIHNMMKTRKDAVAYLSGFLAKLCELWWYEASSSCIQKMQESRRANAIDSLESRLLECGCEETGLTTVLMLEDFKDLSKLKKHLIDRGLDLSLIRPATHEMEYLHVFAELLDGLPSKGGKMLLDNWKTHQAFETGKEHVKECSRFMDMHDALMKTSSQEILRRASDQKESSLDDACHKFYRLCHGIHEELTALMNSAVSDLQEFTLKASAMSESCHLIQERYHKSVDVFIEDHQRNEQRTFEDRQTRFDELSTELQKTAKGLCLTYRQFWTETHDAFESDSNPDWYKKKETGIPDLSEKLFTVSTELKKLYENGVLPERFSFADHGLRWKTTHVTIRNLEVASFLNFSGGRVEIGCSGGTGPDVTIRWPWEVYDQLPLSYRVQDEDNFELRLTLKWSIDKSFEKAFRLRDLFAFNKFPLNCSSSCSLRREREVVVGFKAVKHIVCFGEYLPSDDEEDISVGEHVQSPRHNLASELHSQLAQWEQCVEELKRTVDEEDDMRERERQAALDLEMDAEGYQMPHCPHFQASLAWGSTIDEIFSTVQNASLHCGFDRKRKVQLSQATATELIPLLNQALEDAKGPFFDETLLRIVDPSSTDEDLSRVWTAEMQEYSRQLKQLLTEAIDLGTSAMHSIFIIWMQSTCLALLSVSSNKELNRLDEDCGQWARSLDQSLLSSSDKVLDKLRCDRVRQAAVSLANTRLEWITFCKGLAESRRKIEHLEHQPAILLPGTSLRHSAKLTIIQSNPGVCELSGENRGIDFGTVLYAADNRRAKMDTQLHHVEIMNQTASTMLIHVLPSSTSSNIFSVMAPSRARLYGRSSHRFAFHINEKAVGRVCEIWRLECTEYRLSAEFELHANIQRLAVQLSSDEVDFENLLPDSSEQKRVVYIRNLTDLPILIRSQMQQSEVRSAVSIYPDRVLLPPRKTETIAVLLRPSIYEETIDSLAVIGAVQNFKELKLKGRIVRPRFVLLDNEADRKIDFAYEMPPVRKGHKTTGYITLKNIGNVPVIFDVSTDSSLLKVRPQSGVVPVGCVSIWKMSLKNPRGDGVFRCQAQISVKGHRAKHLTVAGKWLNPIPRFEAASVRFDIMPSDIVEMMERGERALTVTARNTMRNMEDTPVTVYPPKSDCLLFDKRSYTLEGKEEQDVEMKWIVTRLTDKKHKVVFLTDNGTECRHFDVRLVWSNNSFQIEPISRLFLRSVEPGKENRFDLKIITDAPFAIKDQSPQSDMLETLVLQDGNRRGRDRESWQFGTGDMPPMFNVHGQQRSFQIRLETGKASGWIVEDICIEPQEFILIHEDLSRCSRLPYKFTLVAFVSERPNLFAQMIQSLERQSSTSRTANGAEVSIPDLDILPALADGSSVQSFLLLMLCEMEVLRSEWNLYEDEAREILESSPREATQLCARRVMRLSGRVQQYRSSRSYRDDVRDYFENLIDLFESKGDEAMFDVYLPKEVLRNCDRDVRTVAQALYVLLHTDCPEGQKWRAATACLKTRMKDTASAALFDEASERIAESLRQEKSRSVVESIQFLRSVLLASDEDIAGYQLMDQITETVKNTESDGDLNRVLLNLFPADLRNQKLFVPVLSSTEYNSHEMLNTLIREDIKTAISDLCSGDTGKMLSGFCRLAKEMGSQCQNCDFLDGLMAMLSEMPSLMRDRTSESAWTEARNMIQILLTQERLASVHNPLCTLRLCVSEAVRHDNIRKLTVEAVFSLLPRFGVFRGRIADSIQRAVIEISNGACSAAHIENDRVIKRSLGWIRGYKTWVAVKDLVAEWVEKSVEADADSLVRPLTEFIKLMLERDSFGRYRRSVDFGLRRLRGSLCKALRELDLPSITQDIHPLNLVSRVIAFASLLNIEAEKYLEIASGLSSLAEGFTKENAVSFCRVIAQNVCCDSLSEVVELLDQNVESNEDLKQLVLQALLPENTLESFHAFVQSWTDDVSCVDTSFLEAMESVCERKDLDMLSHLGDLVAAKRAVMTMDEDDMESIEGLLKIRTLVQVLDIWKCWEGQKKSQGALNILFGYAAMTHTDSQTFEQRCISKMVLLLSLADFYRNGHWKKYESSPEDKDGDLVFKTEEIPGWMPPDQESDEEAQYNEDLAEDKGNAMVSPQDEEPIAEDSRHDWPWLLDNFEVPNEQLSPCEADTLSESQDSAKDTASLDDLSDSEIGNWKRCRNNLRKTENALRDIFSYMDNIGSLAEVEEAHHFQNLTFHFIVWSLTRLKGAAGLWLDVFDESVRRCHTQKREEDRTLESRVVCSGVSIISLLRFFDRHLQRDSLFEMPSFLRAMHDDVLQSLGAIPRNNLSADFKKILSNYETAKSEQRSTTEDFPMPSSKLHLPDPQRDVFWKTSGVSDPRAAYRSALESVPMDSAVLTGATTEKQVKRWTDATASYTSDLASAQRQHGILKQKVILHASGGELKLWRPDNRLQEDQETGTEDEDEIADYVVNASRHNAISGHLDECRDQYRSEHGMKAKDLSQECDVFAAEIDDGRTIAVEDNFDVRLKMTQQQLANQDLVRIYKDTAITRADIDKRDLRDPVVVDPSRHEKWTYSLLVDSKPFALFLIEVMRGWEAHFEKFYRSTAEKHLLEWCILVDNSGSMITKETQMIEALVLVMETLRRLEQPFAVARFGDRNSQQMLKMMNEPFTQLVGQRILESFSFDQGTYPASAVRHVAEKVWPANLSEQQTLQTHRVILMIVDGLTQERHAEDYISVCREKGIDLVVLNLKDEVQAELMSQIEALWSKAAACYDVLDVRSVDLLSKLVGGLMIQHMETTLSKIEKNRDRLRSIRQPAIQAQTLLDFALDVDEEAAMADLEKQSLPCLPGNLGKDCFFGCGYSPEEIPFAMETDTLVHGELKMDDMSEEDIFDKIQALQYSLQTRTENKDQLKRAETAWTEAEDQFSAEISHMTEAMERLLLQNRFTRNRADIKGSSIHLPGFIKHIVTRGNEKKIFARKKAGGKFEYAVTILMDISASMRHGEKRGCAVQTVLLLIGALKQMNIEDFSLILFGQSVYPVKLPDTTWEDVSIAMLLSILRRSDEPSSMDADALLFAGSLMEQCCVRGPKKIFVVTDGYGSSGVRLAVTLRKLQESGIDVIAMGIGPEEFFLKKCYPKWITAALPQLVPNALESLTERLEGVTEIQIASQKDTIDWSTVALLPRGTAETVEEILTNREAVFPDLLKLMQTEREAKLIKGNNPSVLTVDICFALDCSGSMSFWINAAKQQIRVSNNCLTTSKLHVVL